MTIYLLMEETKIRTPRNPDPTITTKCIEAFTDERLAKETLTAKQNVYTKAIQDEMSRLSNEVDPFESSRLRQLSHANFYKVAPNWSIEEVELTTDQFTKFALGDK